MEMGGHSGDDLLAKRRDPFGRRALIDCLSPECVYQFAGDGVGETDSQSERLAIEVAGAGQQHGCPLLARLLQGKITG